MEHMLPSGAASLRGWKIKDTLSQTINQLVVSSSIELLINV